MAASVTFCPFLFGGRWYNENGDIIVYRRFFTRLFAGKTDPLGSIRKEPPMPQSPTQTDESVPLVETIPPPPSTTMGFERQGDSIVSPMIASRVRNPSRQQQIESTMQEIEVRYAETFRKLAE